MLILDASAIFAAAYAGDRHHQRCADLLRRARPPLVVPAFAAAEAAYLLGQRAGPSGELQFARSLARGELLVEPVLGADWDRIVELAERYLDLPLGITDASVVALAERLGASDLVTLDRPHFSVVRPRHVPALTLLPDLWT